jgi:hypothetical protein
LPDAAAVAAAVARIEGTALQPQDEYPAPSGHYPAIGAAA